MSTGAPRVATGGNKEEEVQGPDEKGMLVSKVIADVDICVVIAKRLRSKFICPFCLYLRFESHGLLA